MEAIPIVLGIAGMFMQNKGERQQAKAVEGVAGKQEAAGEQAQRIAARNAANTEAETAESVRRETTAATQADATRKARLAASGAAYSGSGANFSEQQRGEADKYIDWLKKSGTSRANIEREQGVYAGLESDATAAGTRASVAGNKSKGLGSMLTTMSGAAGGLGDLYNPAKSTGLDMNSIWT